MAAEEKTIFFIGLKKNQTQELFLVWLNSNVENPISMKNLFFARKLNRGVRRGYIRVSERAFSTILNLSGSTIDGKRIKFAESNVPCNLNKISIVDTLQGS